MFKIMSIENAEIDYSIDSIPTLINHTQSIKFCHWKGILEWYTEVQVFPVFNKCTIWRILAPKTNLKAGLRHQLDASQLFITLAVHVSLESAGFGFLVTVYTIEQVTDPKLPEILHCL